MFDMLGCGPEDITHLSSSFRHDLFPAYDPERRERHTRVFWNLVSEFDKVCVSFDAGHILHAGNGDIAIRSEGSIAPGRHVCAAQGDIAARSQAEITAGLAHTQRGDASGDQIVIQVDSDGR